VFGSRLHKKRLCKCHEKNTKNKDTTKYFSSRTRTRTWVSRTRTRTLNLSLRRQWVMCTRTCQDKDNNSAGYHRDENKTSKWCASIELLTNHINMTLNHLSQLKTSTTLNWKVILSSTTTIDVQHRLLNVSRLRHYNSCTLLVQSHKTWRNTPRQLYKCHSKPSLN